MISHQNLWIPCARNKYSIDAAAEGRGEYVANLKADQEGKGNDDGRVLAIVVVGRRGEDDVAVSEEGAEIGDEGRADGKHRADEAFVDESVDAAVFYHSEKDW